MGPIYLFELASQQNQWLSVRQSTVAQNVANANTPGYKTLDVEPFEVALAKTQLTLATTRPDHFTLPENGRVAPAVDQAANHDTTQSNNNVSIEREFAKAGQITQSFALNTQIIKAFHRMMMASVKG